MPFEEQVEAVGQLIKEGKGGWVGEGVLGVGVDLGCGRADLALAVKPDGAAGDCGAGSRRTILGHTCHVAWSTCKAYQLARPAPPTRPPRPPAAQCGTGG